MSMQIFNSIAANLRRQFPTLSEAMILQKASEIYQAQLGAVNEAAKTQIELEKERKAIARERQKQLQRQAELRTAIRSLGERGLLDGLFNLWRKP